MVFCSYWCLVYNLFVDSGFGFRCVALLVCLYRCVHILLLIFDLGVFWCGVYCEACWLLVFVLSWIFHFVVCFCFVVGLGAFRWFGR